MVREKSGLLKRFMHSATGGDASPYKVRSFTSSFAYLNAESGRVRVSCYERDAGLLLLADVVQTYFQKKDARSFNHICD